MLLPHFLHDFFRQEQAPALQYNVHITYNRATKPLGEEKSFTVLPEKSDGVRVYSELVQVVLWAILTTER